MDDLISRRAAIDALRDAETVCGRGYAFNVFLLGLFKAHKIIADLPSAQPERKKGKWIKRAPSLYRCSECARFSPAQENFCPNCGAEMEKADER